MILNVTVRKLVELLLTEAVIVSKPTENKFEEKLKQTTLKNCETIREQIKQQSKWAIIILRERRRKKMAQHQDEKNYIKKITKEKK